MKVVQLVQWKMVLLLCLPVLRNKVHFQQLRQLQFEADRVRVHPKQAVREQRLAAEQRQWNEGRATRTVEDGSSAVSAGLAQQGPLSAAASAPALQVSQGLSGLQFRPQFLSDASVQGAIGGHHRQRCRQVLREKPEMGSSFVLLFWTDSAVQGAMGYHHMQCCFQACEKGEQWSEALKLFSQVQQRKVQFQVSTCHAAVSPCENGKNWAEPLKFLPRIQQCKFQCMSTDIVLWCIENNLQNEAIALGQDARESCDWFGLWS